MNGIQEFQKTLREDIDEFVANQLKCHREQREVRQATNAAVEEGTAKPSKIMKQPSQLIL